jgi:alkylation response protein AidB-like acyl-CoA dehydrogenase
MYRDARLFRIYERTSEIQELIIGRALVRDNQWEKEGARCPT